MRQYGDFLPITLLSIYIAMKLNTLICFSSKYIVNIIIKPFNDAKFILVLLSDNQNNQLLGFSFDYDT